MDYRKIYQEHYRITIPDGFEIHHINKDREDNRIENLMLLPARVHRDLHIIDNSLGPAFLSNKNYVTTIANNAHELSFIHGIVDLWSKIIPSLMYWAMVKEQEDLAIQNGRIEDGNISYSSFRK